MSSHDDEITFVNPLDTYNKVLKLRKSKNTHICVLLLVVAGCLGVTLVSFFIVEEVSNEPEEEAVFSPFRSTIPDEILRICEQFVEEGFAISTNTINRDAQFSVCLNNDTHLVCSNFGGTSMVFEQDCSDETGQPFCTCEHGDFVDLRTSQGEGLDMCVEGSLIPRAQVCSDLVDEDPEIDLRTLLANNPRVPTESPTNSPVLTPFNSIIADEIARICEEFVEQNLGVGSLSREHFGVCLDNDRHLECSGTDTSVLIDQDCSDLTGGSFCSCKPGEFFDLRAEQGGAFSACLEGNPEIEAQVCNGLIGEDPVVDLRALLANNPRVPTESPSNSPVLAPFNSVVPDEFARICEEFVEQNLGVGSLSNEHFGVCLGSDRQLECSGTDTSVIFDQDCSDLTGGSFCSCKPGEFFDLRAEQGGAFSACSEGNPEIEAQVCSDLIDEDPAVDLRALLANNPRVPTESPTNSPILSPFSSSNVVEFTRICNQYIAESFSTQDAPQFGVCLSTDDFLICDGLGTAEIFQSSCSDITGSAFCDCPIAEYIDLRSFSDVCTESPGLQCVLIDEDPSIDLRTLLENSPVPPAPTASPTLSPIQPPFNSIDVVEFNRICNQYIDESFSTADAAQFGVCLGNDDLLICDGLTTAEIFEGSCSDNTGSSFCNCPVGEYIDLRTAFESVCSEGQVLPCTLIEDDSNIDLRTLLANSPVPPFRSQVLQTFSTICNQFVLDVPTAEDNINFGTCLDDNFFLNCEGLTAVTNLEQCNNIAGAPSCDCPPGHYVDFRNLPNAERTSCTSSPGTGSVQCTEIDNDPLIDLRALLAAGDSP